MPVSNYSNVGPIMNTIRKLDKETPIKSMLDIGFGFGKYGFLCREFFDIRKNRYDKSQWEATIDGVEIWSEYITKMHSYIYDRIFIDDITKIYDSLPAYDLIIMSEVIEHIDQELGMKLLLNIKFNRALIITSPPTLDRRSGRGWKNPYEMHVSLWTPERLSLIFNTVVPLTRTAYLVTHG